MRPPPKSKSKSVSISKSKPETPPVCRSLALVPLGNVSDDLSSKPLENFYPKISSATCLRRSPRLNPSPLHVCWQNVARKGMRRAYSDPALSLRSPEDEKCLRRSPRLHPTSDAKNEHAKLSPKKSTSMLLNASGLRRSPRWNGSGSSDADPESFTKTKSNKRKSISSGRSETEMPDATISRRSSQFNSINGVRGPKQGDNTDKATCHYLTYKAEDDDIVKDVEALKRKSIKRSPSFLSDQLGSEIGCDISLSKEISSRKLESPEEGSIDALPLAVFSAEMNLSKKLEAKQLSFPQQAQFLEPTVSFESETSNFEVRLSHEIAAELSPFLLCENHDQVTALRCCNSYFSDEKLLRRSPRHLSEYKTSDNVECCSEFDMKIKKQLCESPRHSSSCCGAGSVNLPSNFVQTCDKQSKLDNQMSKTRHSPQTSIFACGPKCHKIGHSSCKFLDSDIKHPPEKIKSSACAVNKKKTSKGDSFFIGNPVPADEAQQRWKWRYEMKNQILKGQKVIENNDDEDMIVLSVDCHYTQANIANSIINLGDCVYIKGEGEKDHVGRIVEFFKTTDGDNYFRGQWFYRVEDTVIQEEGPLHDERRLFYSRIMNDNPIDCIVSKVSISQIKPRVGSKLKSVSSFDFYYDMEYCVDYSTFRTLTNDESLKDIDTAPTNSTATTCVMPSMASLENIPKKADLELLDLYSGCGGMSTGLCLGAKHSSVGLVTRWAVDSHKSACDSLKLNHPETYVRNESAEDFLELLKQWEKLCRQYKENDVESSPKTRSKLSDSKLNSVNDKLPTCEFEVSSVVDICYGDPRGTGKRGLNFMVHWKGYGSSEDTWEPVEGLSNCKEAIKDFVRKGLKLKVLPLPGDVDVICGGPPCQGISGYNRFRNMDSPMADERNRQIVVFMDIVKFLQPKFVLMENVTDILRFDKASLARYAVSRLVHMNYQSRLGIIAAGSYGLPQFRLRVFLWGAHPSEKLPQFPLPTHEVVVRYWPPPEFERNTVAYDEEQHRELEKAVFLEDAISDLPAVVLNSEAREEMPYEMPPKTVFQRYIRSSQYEMMGSGISSAMAEHSLYDHRPYYLHEDDYLRVCNIPKRKGANFRDLPGVVVGSDNVARRDVKNEVVLPSGKPMVPDYTFTFEQGKSRRPFARLWWDETVPTVVTFPSCHNQAALHPEQDRVLTIREYARLQGFPDYYRFCGTVKQRYRQVGNAVAVSVSRALGCVLGLAVRRVDGDEPLVILPPNFSLSNYIQLQTQTQIQNQPPSSQ